ncbi:tetratricopeptide repeat protein [bacterium]|nr:MAG: tetratricopeptide repeat protein [bacterium]
MSLSSLRWILLVVSASAWIFALYWFYNAWQTSQPYNNAIYASLAGLASLIGVIINRPKDDVSTPSSSASGQGAIQSSSNVSATDGSISTGNIYSHGNVEIKNIYGSKKPSAPTYQPHEIQKADELPERADLPPGSLIPFLPNAVFTGRREDLLDLAKDLLHSKVQAVGLTQAAAVATGYGGIGKTQLAVEFCYRYGRFFQGVHWIRADQDIPAEISACGEVMGLSSWPKEQPEQVKATLKAWREGKPWLVVLDNVTDQAVVKEWMPQMPRCRLLITSRQPKWPLDMGLKIRPLNIFAPDKSRELLCKLAPRLNKEAQADLDKIAARLGNLPLALDLAGRYLTDRSSLNPKDYLKALEDEGNALKHSSLKDWVMHNPTEHATNLAATFALSWDRLGDDGVDGLAKRIFRFCGYCAPNTPIPVVLLAKAVGTDESKEKLDQALNRLSLLGMVILTDGRPVLHPLLAEFARMQDEMASVLPELANALINIAYQANMTGLPENVKPFREHLEVVARAADARSLPSASSLWSNLAFYLRNIAEHESAKKHYERALQIDEKTYGPDHPTVAIRVNNLGYVLQSMGDLPAAKSHYERALQIDEKTYGPDHPDVATMANNLGGVLRAMGDLPSAKSHYERALQIDEKIYGPDHPAVARDVNNLGGVLVDLGDLPAAKSHYERALKIGEQTYGPDHPTVAIRVNNLGGVLRDLGDFPSAKSHYERALKIDEKTYGPDHPTVATIANNLGGVLQALGDLPSAKSHYERALRIDEKTYGPDHPDVAIDVNNLGSVLQAMGDLPSAKSHYERALKICRTKLGEDHPNTKTVLNNLNSLPSPTDQK